MNKIRTLGSLLGLEPIKESGKPLSERLKEVSLKDCGHVLGYRQPIKDEYPLFLEEWLKPYTERRDYK